jgi:hypothetical protein
MEAVFIRQNLLSDCRLHASTTAAAAAAAAAYQKQQQLQQQPTDRRWVSTRSVQKIGSKSE